MRFRPPATLFAILVPLWLALATAVASAANLSNVSVAPLPDGTVRITVQFTGGPPPKFTVAGGGTTETSVIFQNASLGSNMAPSVAGSGAVQSITLSEVGDNVAMSLHLSSPAA